LTEAMRPGTCEAVAEIVDAQTGERFAVDGQGLRLVTTAHVAGRGEKARLASSYRAELVDMEAAAVARLAQMRGIPMRCFKGVSDGVGAELPDLNPFIDVDGKLRMAAFLAHVAVRPQYWAALVHMGRNSAAGAAALAEVTGAFLRDGRVTKMVGGV
jgi:adenosylhomocysteine nucleosidase